MNDLFFKRLQAIAAFFGAVGVMFGAFGAHFLKSRLQPADIETLKTGVLYLFIHALAALIVCVIAQRRQVPSRWLKAAGIAFIAGILMFSGSLFVISTKSLTGFPASTIGFITPLGGLGFIMGWLFLMFDSRSR